jgi:hypothetical protein
MGDTGIVAAVSSLAISDFSPKTGVFSLEMGGTLIVVDVSNRMIGVFTPERVVFNFEIGIGSLKTGVCGLKFRDALIEDPYDGLKSCYTLLY